MPNALHRSQGTQPPPPLPTAAPTTSQNVPLTRPVFAGSHPIAQHHLAQAKVIAPTSQLPISRNPKPQQIPVRSPRCGGASNATGSVAVGGPGPLDLKDGMSRKARHMSSDDSGETEPSDPAKWFDRSNENPGQSFGPRGMDVDPPFFQKEFESSNEELSKETSTSYAYPSHLMPPQADKPTVPTSSAEDYRSVIDDLTIEIKRLKEELRKYKGNVPDALKRDALFEVRVHGLTQGKKRELENRLREFATSVSGSSGTGVSSARQKPSFGGANRTLGSTGAMSKHTSSTGNSRPIDSAYASMSNAGLSNNHVTSSSSLPLAGQTNLGGRARTAEQKVQSYLEDIPEGLFPRHVVMTEKEKKKLVVKRLEKIFTGRMGGQHQQHSASTAATRPPPRSTDPSLLRNNTTQPHNPADAGELSREARMLTGGGGIYKKESVRDNTSTSASGGGDQTESGGAAGGGGNGAASGNGSGSGNGNDSARSSRRSLQSPSAAKYEQRPTSLRDLDPDRIQLPSENMEYFRHLGIPPPSNLSETAYSSQDVAPGAGGWVYLNLLCNMAQLHILNVTPSFIRKAVAEKSVKFQISADGQKIRWRGGTEGTRFSSSDSSSGNSRRSRSTDEEYAPESGVLRKKIKTQHPGNSDEAAAQGSGSTRSGKKNLRLNPQNNHASSQNSFHYKPILVHQSSPEQTSDEAVSLGSLGRGVDSNGNSNSRWDFSGAGGSSGSNRRRVEGSIMYYHGVPFCTDLSRDPPAGFPPPSQDHDALSSSPVRSTALRTISGSSIPTRPVSALQMALPNGIQVSEPDSMLLDEDDVIIFSPSDCSDDDDLFPWGDAPEKLTRPRIEKLEASGLGGVNPDDHFLVHVTTKRPKLSGRRARSGSAQVSGRPRQSKSDDATDAIISRIADMTTSSPAPLSRSPSRSSDRAVLIQYVSGRVKKLQPSPLPPPATFLPPFSSDEEDEEDYDEMDIDLSDDMGESSALVHLADNDDSEGLLSRLANPHLSDNTSEGAAELSSGDEEDEVDGEAEAGYDPSNGSGPRVPGIAITISHRDVNHDSSSAATAGGGMDSSPSGSSDGDR